MVNVHDIARAYGCTPTEAKLVLNGRTVLHRAIRQLGPIRAYYSASRKTWTLDQKPASAQEIINAAMKARPAA